MKFKLGDVVEVLDEAIKAKVIGFSRNEVEVETEDGFQLRFPPKHLVKLSTDIQVTNYQIAQIKKEKEIPKRKRDIVPKAKERNAPKMEVDLHINQLVKSTRGMGNFDILEIQLATAKRQLEFAIQKRIQKVVFIHGVGEGVLKTELHYLFKKYENIKYYDAEYRKYGLGATEVYILQNP